MRHRIPQLFAIAVFLLIGGSYLDRFLTISVDGKRSLDPLLTVAVFFALALLSARQKV